MADGRVEVLGEEEVVEVVDGEGRLPETRGAGAALKGSVNDPLRRLQVAIAAAVAVGAPRGGEVAAELVDAHVRRAAGEAGEERAHILRRGRVAEREPAREEDAALVRPHRRRLCLAALLPWLARFSLCSFAHRRRRVGVDGA